MHWQTHSYARHMAYGELYDSLVDLIDNFIEVYQGKYERVKVDENGVGIQVYNSDSKELQQWLAGVISFLTSELPACLSPEEDTDLLNIRDEMLSAVNKLKYKLSFKK